MRRALLVPLPFVLLACHPRYRTETLGHGTAVTTDAAATAAPGGGGVTVPAPGLHDVSWSIRVPRAMRVAWTISRWRW